MAGNQNELKDIRTSRFHDMIRVLRVLQTSQKQSPGYIVENVPVVSSLRSKTLEGMHQIHKTLELSILLDAVVVGSRVHRPRLW